ncbi:MAG: RAMP superfamily CRISPR-associated protein, partial [Saprospiraceae bacterium]
MNNKFKEYTIEFHSYWHVGSGLFGGTEADNLVNKDKVGLPYIPGKTLKGLLRQAATELMELDDSFVTQSFIDDVFGEKPKKEIRINDRGEEEEGFID